jgi:hypothetical protein
MGGMGHSHHFERARGVSVCPLLLRSLPIFLTPAFAATGKQPKSAAFLLVYLTQGLMHQPASALLARKSGIHVAFFLFFLGNTVVHLALRPTRSSTADRLNEGKRKPTEASLFARPRFEFPFKSTQAG